MSRQRGEQALTASDLTVTESKCERKARTDSWLRLVVTLDQMTCRFVAVADFAIHCLSKGLLEETSSSLRIQVEVGWTPRTSEEGFLRSNLSFFDQNFMLSHSFRESRSSDGYGRVQANFAEEEGDAGRGFRSLPQILKSSLENVGYATRAEALFRTTQSTSLLRTL